MRIAMFPFAMRGERNARAMFRQALVEVLENRQLLSGAGVSVFDTVEPPVAAIDITATAGKRFHDVVGNWTVTGGLPAKSSGTIALATIDWGDGKTSKGKFVDDGSGIVQITGSHSWKAAGTFQTVVKVQEYPKGHKTETTDIGQADGSAVVAPKPHKVSVKGTFTGTYTTPLGNPDARSYVFTGTGTAGALGTATLDGTVTPPGFILSAPASGELTLTAPNGTVTLDLSGKPQPGGSPVPQKMTYVMSDSTGDFVNGAAKGSVAIALDTTANTFVMVIH
jgi:hypothetical protein